ncbi:hypothetical protein D9M68_961540 [compost metagenome]
MRRQMVQELLAVTEHFFHREAGCRRCVGVVLCFLMKELKRRVESQAADGIESAGHDEWQDQVLRVLQS